MTSAMARINLGDALFDEGNLNAALEAYQDSVTTFEQMPKGGTDTIDWSEGSAPPMKELAACS